MHGIIAAAVLAASPALFASEVPSEQHVKWMKESGELSGKVRKGVEVEASAKRMAAIYKEVEGFWGKRSAIGAKASKDAQAAANELAKAAASGDAAAIGAASKVLGGTCRGCHDAHREKVSDTEYKIK
jgi:hypothetical protein